MKILIKQSGNKRDINIKIPMSIVIIFIRIGINFVKVNKDDKSVSLNCNKNKENKKVNIVFADNKLPNLLNNVEKKNLIKGLKYLQKNHKGLVLVEVDESSGDKVRIEI